MDPTVLLGILAAGATAAAKDTAGQAVKDAYAGLKTAIQRRFSDEPTAKAAVEEIGRRDNALLEQLLSESIERHHVHEDPDVVKYVKRLRELGVVELKQDNSGDSYTVTAEKISGSIFGRDGKINIYKAARPPQGGEE